MRVNFGQIHNSIILTSIGRFLSNFWEAGLLLLTPGVEVLSSSSPDTAAAAIIRRSSRTARHLGTSAAQQPHSTKTIICTQPPMIARCPVLGCSDGVLFNHRVHLSPPLQTAAQRHGKLPGNDVCRHMAIQQPRSEECQQLQLDQFAPIYFYKLMNTTCYNL